MSKGTASVCRRSLAAAPGDVFRIETRDDGDGQPGALTARCLEGHSAAGDRGELARHLP